MNIDDLVGLLGAEVTPCQKYRCPKRAKCAEERLACDAFLVYVDKGWALHPQLDLKATRRLSNQVFGADIKPTRAKFKALDRECPPSDATREEEVYETLFRAAESRTDLDMAWL
jgi:hypothetical protein